MRVAFIGLGNMGSPMALNVLRAGNQLTVFNRTVEKTKPLADAGARVVTSAAEAVANCEVVMTMLGNDAAVQDSLLSPSLSGRPAIDVLPQNAVHMSCSTISVECSKKLAEQHATRHQQYLVTTVLGRPEAAADKKLWVMVGGESPVIQRCQPLIDAIGRGSSIVGTEPWQANLIKIAANFTLASFLEILGEAFALVRKSGMDPHQYLEVVNSIVSSPVFYNYGRRIADRQFEPAGFLLKWGLKDISLALEAGEDVSAPLPLASLIRDHYLTAIARGRESQDWSAVAEIAMEEAGLE